MGPLCQRGRPGWTPSLRPWCPCGPSSVDPRADAIGKLADLLGGNPQRVRAIVAALDPVILPLFLEAGCILMFGAAFPHRRLQAAIGRNPDAIVYTHAAMNQKELATVWGVHPRPRADDCGRPKRWAP